MVLADMATFPFVRQFAAVPLPRVRHWLAGQAGSAMFARAMLRVPLWREGELGVLFAP